MSWEARWREMVLAGGVLAGAACSASSSGSSPDSGTGVPAFCCNGSSDPCCEYQSCGGPLTPQCTAKMACDADGGHPYDPLTNSCGIELEGGPLEPDAPASDAPTDSPADAPVFWVACCNADPDPCCNYRYCGAPLSALPACVAWMACVGDGGVPVFPPDAGYTSGCSFSQEAGPADATPDSEPPDAGGG